MASRSCGLVTPRATSVESCVSTSLCSFAGRCRRPSLCACLPWRGKPLRCRPSAEGAPVSRICRREVGDVPQEVRTFITGQLGLLWDRFEDYPWYTSTRDYHLAQVRKFTGWRFLTAQDKLELEQWLRREAAYESQSAETLLDAACERLRCLRVEVHAEKELERVEQRAQRFLSGYPSAHH
jgi:hypothetical protein